MQKICLGILFSIFLALPSFAQNLEYQGGYNPQRTENQYFQESNYRYTKSIIYVFVSRSSCHNCDKAVRMLQDAYNKYYQGKYEFYVINDYNDVDLDYNYISTYRLRGALEVVLARVANGRADGYEKIDNIQNHISNKNGFEREFRSRVDSFF